MDVQNLNRRRFLRRTGAGLSAGLIAFTGTRALAQEAPVASEAPTVSRKGAIHGKIRLQPIKATRDRLIKMNAGLRPFREVGPNRSVEQIAGKTVVHNYGHGGSGWSLSWGCALEAREKVLATGAQDVAVIGCGAVGLSTAIMLQKAGLNVTIYTKDRDPNITSTMATGVWSPDSRICLHDHADTPFADWWEKTTRASFREYQHLLGLPGSPVEWVDGFSATNLTQEQLEAERESLPGPSFAHFRERVADLTPKAYDLAQHEHPFTAKYARQTSGMIFNIPAYMNYLIGQVTSVGGRIHRRVFTAPEEFGKLSQPTIVNCTGFGSKSLFQDRHLVPVWGQMSFLVPQPEVNYRFSNDNTYAVPRRDGIALAIFDNGRYGETEAYTDRDHAYKAIDSIAESMAGMKVT